MRKLTVFFLLITLLTGCAGSKGTGIYTENNINISGAEYDIPATVCIPDGAGPYPAVVMLHGTASKRDEVGDAYKYAAHTLASKYGIATIRIDFAGYGESKADQMQYDYESGISDALSAADCICGYDNVKTDPVGIMGWSQGGAVALLACARNPEKFSSIVTWAAAPDMPDTGIVTMDDYNIAKEQGYYVKDFDWRDSVTFSLKWFDDAFNTDVIGEFKEGYKGPILAIAGTEDVTVNPKWSRKIVESSSNKGSELYMIEGMDHTFNVFSEEDLHSLYNAIDKTGEFFVRTLR